MKVAKGTTIATLSILCMIFAASLLAGCSKAPEGDAGKASTSAPAKTAPAAPAAADDAPEDDEDKFGC